MALYLLSGETQQGPYEESAVREMMGRGEVSPDQLAWREGLSDWQPVKSFFPPPPPTLAPIPAPAIPQAPAAAVETVLWQGHPSSLNFCEMGYFRVLE